MPNAYTNETYHTDGFDYAGTDLNTKHVIELLLQYNYNMLADPVHFVAREKWQLLIKL